MNTYAPSAPPIHSSTLPLYHLEQTPLLSSNQNISQQGLDWNKRHISLNPKWYQVEKIVHRIGNYSLGGGILSGLATGYTAFFFAATPTIVIATVGSLAIFSIATTIAGIAFKMKKTFWQDPAYRIEVAKKIIQDVEKNDLSYIEMQKKYGEMIRKYALLNKTDINDLLYRDAKTLSYPAFRQKHFTKNSDLFNQLDELNIAALRQSFSKHLSYPNGGLAIPYTDLKTTYQQELIVFEKDRILENLINDLLLVDAQAFSYSDFVKTHFSNHISGLNELPAEFIRILRDKFLAETAKIGFNEIWINHQLDCKALGINQYELQMVRLQSDIYDVLNNQLDYDVFKSQNNLEELPELLLKSPHLIVPLGQKLLDHISFRKEGFLWIQEHFRSDLNVLDGPEQPLRKAIFDAVMHNQLHQLEQNQLNYLQFRANNGLPFIKECIEHYPNSKNQLRDIFISQACTWNQGIRQLQMTYEECQLFEINNQLESVIIPIELNKLNQRQMTYSDFKQRNGYSIIKELRTHRPLFKMRFLEMPYAKMTDPQYEEDKLNILSLSKKDIEKALIEEAQILPYSQGFRTKHKLDLFDSSNDLSEETLFQLRSELRNKLKIELNNKSYAEIITYRRDCEILGISIYDLIKQDLDGKYHSFKSKHGLEPFIDGMIPHIKIKQFKLALQEEINAVPFNQIINYSKDFTIFDLSLNKALEQRWQSKSILEVFHSPAEKQAFCSAVKTGQMIADQWSAKVLTDTQNIPILTLLKNYSELFELKILSPLLHPSLKTRFEKEIQMISTFEDLSANYGNAIFDYQFATSLIPRINFLVTNYYKRYPYLSHTPSPDKNIQLIEKFNLQSSYLIQEINTIQSRVKETMNAYHSECQKIHQDYEDHKKHIEKIFNQSMDYNFNSQKSIEKQRDLKEKMQTIENEIRKFDSQKSDLSTLKRQAIDQLNNYQTEKQKLELLAKNYPIEKSRLENKIQSLQNSHQVTGIVAAISAKNNQKEIEKSKNALLDLENIPTKTQQIEQNIAHQTKIIEDFNASLAKLQHPLQNGLKKEVYQDAKHQLDKMNEQKKQIENKKTEDIKKAEVTKYERLKSADQSRSEKIRNLEALFSHSL